MGKLVLIVMLFLTSNFFNLKITEGFFLGGMQDAFKNQNIGEIMGENVENYKPKLLDYAKYITKSEEEFSDEMFGKVMGEMIKKEEIKNGFIKSNKAQILKSGNFEIKSSLKFSDGLKNGCGVVFIGAANICKGFINLITGKEGKKADYLSYSLLSVFTQILTFFFMAGNIFYYLGFIISVICSGSLLFVLVIT